MIVIIITLIGAAYLIGKRAGYNRGINDQLNIDTLAVIQRFGDQL